MPRRKEVKECACCDNILGYKQQRYCSEKCAKMYKSGVLMYGVGKIKFGFNDWTHALKRLINQAEKQGHEYVTVRFKC